MSPQILKVGDMWKPILVALTLAVTSQSMASEPVRSLNSDLFIPNGELEALRQKALSGDPQAALRLELYYAMWAHDSLDEFRWASIGAENGNAVSEYNFGFLLWRKQTVADKIRAMYWMAKAADAGDARAAANLAHMQKGEEF